MALNSINVVSLSIFILWISYSVICDWRENYYDGSCDEETCARRVSKCMLIKSCNCSMTPEDLASKNCTCCKECVACLGIDDLFSQCCSCVGLCRGNRTLNDPCLSLQSYVYDLTPDTQLKLFEQISDQDFDQWTVRTFPVSDADYFKQVMTDNRDHTFFYGKNCSVLFFKKCMAMDQCHRACESVGASSLRWFHTGCCECAGLYCMNYGLKTNLCEDCGDLEESKNCSSPQERNLGRNDEL